jgi:hypothetical protein
VSNAAVFSDRNPGQYHAFLDQTTGLYTGCKKDDRALDSRAGDTAGEESRLPGKRNSRKLAAAIRLIGPARGLC